MQRELKRLLHSNQLEQDLLGLVTAAGGGLSSRDLAELTNMTVNEIEDTLHTVAGRSFASRREPGTAGAVYILGHEELQITAARILGAAKLTGYLSACISGLSNTASSGLQGRQSICCVVTIGCCTLPRTSLGSLDALPISRVTTGCWMSPAAILPL